MNKLLLSLSFLPLALMAQDDPWEDDDWGEERAGPVWTGFLEAGLGRRFSRDPLLGSANALEDLRWRIESAWEFSTSSLSFKADAGYDGIEDDPYADLRDLSWSWRISNNTDLKLGRQVQTWGTGDLLFLNDLFPKDFVSFFAGRDNEYLKSPGDAVRLTHFSTVINVDFVWTPVFEPDVYLSGERFSFFSPLAGQNIAPAPPLSAIEPAKTFNNGEFALRLFRTAEGREYAVYAYYGFFKQPTAQTANLLPTFAPLTAIGASLRQPAGPGLMNAEFSFYESRDDSDGTNPLMPNGQLRILAGYEWEAAANFNIGLQYYLERMLDYDELIANSPAPQFEPDEYRHLITNRLTYRVARDKFTYSLFTFWSPSDNDFYLRPQFSYRRSDEWTLSAGASIFAGSEPHTFFSQLEDASNIYLRLRYSY